MPVKDEVYHRFRHWCLRVTSVSASRLESNSMLGSAICITWPNYVQYCGYCGEKLPQSLEEAQAKEGEKT